MVDCFNRFDNIVEDPKGKILLSFGGCQSIIYKHLRSLVAYIESWVSFTYVISVF